MRGVTVLRFKRCCRSLNGAVSPSRTTSSSPSSTACDCRKAETISGNAGEMSSPEREKMRASSAVRGDLHAHAVPFPLGGHLVGNKTGPVALLDRMGEHERAEDELAFGAGAFATAFEPGKEIRVRRGKRVPDLLDLGDLAAAHLGRARSWQAARRRRRAARRRAASERPAAARIETVEKPADHRTPSRLRSVASSGDDLGEPWRRLAPRASGHSSETVSAVSPT